MNKTIILVTLLLCLVFGPPAWMASLAYSKHVLYIIYPEQRDMMKKGYAPMETSWIWDNYTTFQARGVASDATADWG